MADVFDSTPNEENNQLSVTLEDLVGDERKYKNPDDLAKAYANAENHLRTLERENAQLRQQQELENATNQNKSGEEKRQENPGETNQSQSQSSEQNEGSRSRPNEADEDISSRIRQEVESFNQEKQAEENLNSAVKAAMQVYGDEEQTAKAIRDKANELGVSVDWLKDTARKSPNAFYSAMGISDRAKSSSTPAPRSDTRPERGTGRKNFEHYERIRKEDPKAYWSRPVQDEMMAQARQQGSDFYN